MPVPDLSHLLDNDPNTVPDLPKQPVLERREVLNPGAGMRVQTAGDETIVSAQPDSGFGFGGGGGGISYIDPLATVSFRLSQNPAGVTVATSYVNNMYYDNGWVHEHFQIPTETLPISVWPQYAYLKLPVKWVSGLPPSAASPVQLFTSDPQTINGGGYTFEEELTTGYTARDRGVTPVNYFILSQILINDNTIPPGGTGFWHLFLGTVNQGSIEQTQVGAWTLPQTFNFNCSDFQVS